MSTTRSAPSTLTPIPAREAAQACLEAGQRLAPSVPSTEVHRIVHRAAQALQEALIAGATLAEILAALVALTAPAAPEAPPAPPWANLLGCSLDAFAQTGAALAVSFPALGVQVWWSGSDAMARAVARERRLSMREIWRRDRMQQEARSTGLDPETVTVESLLVALGGAIRGWRPAA